MTVSGYYRFPTIHGETVVFVCEDDLWTVPVGGGIARRLTANLGMVAKPALSPDGQWLAFTGREEGSAEVFIMPALGGQAIRLTFLGASTQVVGWTPDGQEILFASDTAQPFGRLFYLYALPRDGGEPRLLPTGPAVSISFGPDGGRVIGRHAADLASWKRYRGGTAGEIWLDPDGSGRWQRLPLVGDNGMERSNVALPLWLGDRIYFISDHEGIGNLYSTPSPALPLKGGGSQTPSPAPRSGLRPAGRFAVPQQGGGGLRRHTDHDEFYVRDIASDGRRIVYAAGGDLYLYDPATDSGHRIDVQLHSPRIQRNRKFVNAYRYLQDYDIHPEGHSVALVSRGQAFSMANWEGAVVQHGETTVTIDGTEVAVRRRLMAWLRGGQRLVAFSDADGEETVEIYQANAAKPPKRLTGLDIGRPVGLAVSPRRDQVAIDNHRNELVLIDLAEETARVLDRSPYARLRGLAWSPDGRWLAYGYPNSAQTSLIRLCQVETGEIWDVTRPVLRDQEPAFDPEGNYLYFLSARHFDPVYDNLHFDLNFPWGMRPYLVTLRQELPSPFIPQPRAPGEKGGKGDGDDDKWYDLPEADEPAAPAGGDTGPSGAAGQEGGQGQAPATPADGGPEGSQAGADGQEEKVIRIDVEGIADRIVAFPVSDGLYDQIRGLPGKVLFSSWPAEGSLGDRQPPGAPPPAHGVLEIYDFAEQKHEPLLGGITNFELSLDGNTLVYRSGNRLRVLKAGEKPENRVGTVPGRVSGWLDLGRLKVSVDPGAEWAQMYRHAWRLQRDQFWTADMSGVDWQRVYRRYWPLLSRVATRAEFSDLMWEMQGELGTSHAYVMGGDYRPEPKYYQGFLGADVTYDEDRGGWRIVSVVRGDPWDTDADSPLNGPGINVTDGDVLLAIGGRAVSRDLSPQQLLVNQAGEEILLTVAAKDGAEPRTVTVKALRSERAARYRRWVEANRRLVHQASGGRVGYVHIPDMGPEGYAEFHRGFLAEVIREGLLVDVRFNRGGHVSPLLLEKLSRRRIGYDVSRWHQPDPYPPESVMGPVVALTNEYAGSDGDIFSHAFKLMGLGPLIGRRTWGGVVGIWPRESLIDGGQTTQPEFSFWFEDVGFGVENYGTDPDIEVEITPEDYAAGRDPQLDRAIAEILRLLAENPPRLPDFNDRPRRDLPALPR